MCMCMCVIVFCFLSLAWHTLKDNSMYMINWLQAQAVSALAASLTLAQRSKYNSHFSKLLTKLTGSPPEPNAKVCLIRPSVWHALFPYVLFQIRLIPFLCRVWNSGPDCTNDVSLMRPYARMVRQRNQWLGTYQHHSNPHPNPTNQLTTQWPLMYSVQASGGGEAVFHNASSIVEPHKARAHARLSRSSLMAFGRIPLTSSCRMLGLCHAGVVFVLADHWLLAVMTKLVCRIANITVHNPKH